MGRHRPELECHLRQRYLSLTGGSHHMTGYRNPLHCILPPGVLSQLARSAEDVVRNAALDTLALDQKFRLTRAEAAGRLGGRQLLPVTFGRIGGSAQRTIYDQQHSTSQSPGKVARAEGQRAVKDVAINQAYD